MKPIFSVVPLNPPIERKGRLYHWGCYNRLTGRIWKQSYRVTRQGAESKCRLLNLETAVDAEHHARLLERETLRSWSSKTLH